MGTTGARFCHSDLGRDGLELEKVGQMNIVAQGGINRGLIGPNVQLLVGQRPLGAFEGAARNNVILEKSTEVTELKEKNKNQ